MPTLAAYGHSYVQGDGASTASRCFVNVAAARLACVLENNGVGGSLSTHTASTVRTARPSSSEFYVLMTGANDARLHGRWAPAQDHYAIALVTIFDAFTTSNPGSRIIAIAQPYLGDYSQHAPYDRGSDAVVDAYNQRLHQVAERYPSVNLARIESWDPTTMIAADTVHPNDLGHKEIARTVWQIAR